MKKTERYFYRVTYRGRDGVRVDTEMSDESDANNYVCQIRAEGATSITLHEQVWRLVQQAEVEPWKDYCQP